MPETPDRIKAVGMLSGGLDSTLATHIIRGLGVEVYGVNFHTGFCLTDLRRSVNRRGTDPKKVRNEALRAGKELAVPVEIIDISGPEYQAIVRHPQYGHGKNMNPCVDCRIFMLRRARAYMEEVGAHFIFTGEVLGQRPKSQHRQAMRTIERDAGLEGLLLRPLSAHLLEPTIPEQEGWVDRERLLGLHGRSRKGQMHLARELGVEDYPQPAGGCCSLTDENFVRRFRDKLDHVPEEHVLSTEEVVLLKVGRQLRVSDRMKLIVGRDESENTFLERFRDRFPYLHVTDHSSPLVLVEGTPTAGDLTLAARIAARYSAGKNAEAVTVRVVEGKSERWVTVAPNPPESTDPFLL